MQNKIFEGVESTLIDFILCGHMAIDAMVDGRC
jgi:hypothetical protein